MKSPCTSICRFDAATGWCLACGRTRGECRDWKRRPETQPGIARRLPARIEALREGGRRAGKEARK
ncbi:DUF1289 domain-containing protein [Roseomonas sp. OT10]|uniref:DUF1289 domain-containing protein n=1 Tax=Roseomonas cutis TaxID=2897332 RepID=UPI001E3F585F|nr:DUF1289 domain-containing protein [Roseomonas sp. OT10]UFN47485.1 DUF1289 domain-containing protein [Roseomonas sp. OT10]